MRFGHRLLTLAAIAFPLFTVGTGWLAAEQIAVTQYGVSLYGAPFTVAKAEGLFAKAGIDLDGFTGSAGGGTTVRNILASSTPYGEVSFGAAIAAKLHGLDVVIVNVGTRSVAESTLVTTLASPVRSIEDLVGRKVAITSPRGSSEMIFLLELQAKKIEPSKIQRVASGGYVNGLTMIEQGAADAAGLIEPLSITRAERYRTIARAKDILQPMTTSVGITTPAFAKAHPDKIRAIIAGRRAAVEDIYAHPQTAADIIGKEYKMEPDVAKVSVDNMVVSRMWSPGGFDKVELDRALDGLRLVGEIAEPVDVTTMIDASFLPKDLQGKL